MLPMTPDFVVHPTRIANVVHYLIHGEVIKPVVVTNEDKFQQFLNYLETKKRADTTWSKVK